jgi:hypothetical protein
MAILDPQAAVFGRLTADSGFTARLSSYNSAPAIFSDVTPHDHVIDDKPIIVISAPSQNENDDTYTEDYRDLTMGIRLYHRPQGSSADLEAASEHARQILKSWPEGAITNGSLVDASVSGPVAAPTEDPALEGRLLQVRLRIKET